MPAMTPSVPAPPPPPARGILNRIAGVPAGFRARGTEVSRIEAFSDAVFAFALALLVVRLDVPRAWGDLRQSMLGFPAFAVCFLVLLYVWASHHAFFRRFGLRDSLTLVLNGVLLFLVLFYVYPLKFLFAALQEIFTRMPAVAGGVQVTQADMREVMLLYGGGFLAVSLVLVLLNLHALRHRHDLDLNALELAVTTGTIRSHAIDGGVATLSLAVVVAEGAAQVKWSGFVYFLIPVLQFTNGWITGRRCDALRASGAGSLR